MCTKVELKHTLFDTHSLHKVYEFILQFSGNDTELSHDRLRSKPHSDRSPVARTAYSATL